MILLVYIIDSRRLVIKCAADSGNAELCINMHINKYCLPAERRCFVTLGDNYALVRRKTKFCFSELVIRNKLQWQYYSFKRVF